jgi:hypothetical protein
MTTMITVPGIRDVAQLRDNGDVIVNTTRLGQVCYDYGFARFVAMTSDGKIRHFTIGTDNGKSAERRAAQWVLRQWSK